MTGVRPTKRSLNDLGLSFPPLEDDLSEMDHDLVAKAQRLPEELASGGAERVRDVADHVWFKVKVGEYRGAGGHVNSVVEGTPSLWWLVAAGVRRSDSKSQDFYEQLAAECKREAKGTAQNVDSDHLLPQLVDYRRYHAEQLVLGSEALKRVVREAICRSAHTSQPVARSTESQQLIAWVKSKDGDTYLAIAAEGFLDPNQIAVLLSAVPGLSADDWIAEPSEMMGIKPSAGQIVFSTMLPPHTLAALLDESQGGFL